MEGNEMPRGRGEGGSKLMSRVPVSLLSPAFFWYHTDNEFHPTLKMSELEFFIFGVNRDRKDLEYVGTRG